MRNPFDQILERRKTDCIKWRYYDEDVLPMWVADMDFVSPEPVIRALRERAEHGVFGYPESVLPDSKAESDLRAAIIDNLGERYKWQVLPEDLVFIPGVVTGFNLACHMAADPGKGVLVQTPVYPPVLAAPGTAGLARQEMELSQSADGSYRIDMDAFFGAINEDTCLFLLTNPQNPVGRVFSEDELAVMAQTCLRKGVLICSDEIHCDLVYSGHRHTPIASLDPEIALQTITLMAPSKTYNLAGLQCSFAVIQNPEIRKKYLGSGKGLVSWVNAMGVTAALAAYREGGEWLCELLGYLEQNRDYLYDFIRSELPSIKLAKPEGTYLAWLDCRESGILENPYRFFLEKGRVAFNDGLTFGRGGEGFIRLNFGCPREQLEEALRRMKNALNSHNRQARLE
jgi:cystathionine beta-lyase